MKQAISKTDFYTQQAKKENYPSRSVYKLKEIDEKFRLFKKGDKILDLGCAPGSWMLYIAEKVGKKGKVVGLDIQEIKIPLQGNMFFVKADVFKVRASGDLCLTLNDKYQGVVSDLAPKTSGIRARDASMSLLLVERTLEIAKKVLMKGGNFVCKVFEGENSERFLKEAAKNFCFVKKFKPKATTKGSREFYCVTKGFNEN